MTFWLGSAALATAVLSAMMLYAGSPHCRWSSMPRLRSRPAGIGALALAALSLLAWSVVAGFGVGLCTMLACWMLSLMALPYLALLGNRQRVSPVEDADVG